MTTTETRPTLRRRSLLAAAACMVGLTLAARADAAGLVDLQVVDRETGEQARVWSRDGRLFVAGRPGARYSLRVSNNTGGRVLVVMSVDGVNVLTGESAAYGQRGYVFEPYQSYEVNGWRKSDTEVAAFTFAPLSRSYAARTGRPGDVGVIGVAAFTERAAPPPPPIAVSPQAKSSQPRAESLGSEDVETAGGGVARSAPAQAPSSRLAEARPAERLGTGHGQRERSVVTTVAFERATAYPQFIRRIEYDSRENLVAKGVIPQPRVPGRPPRPFPASPGYVPDPPRG